jgi:hypothetical protein
MAEKEYSDIVQEEAEKLRDVLGPQKKKKARWDDAEDSVTDIFTVLVGGPAIVVILMGIGLVFCEMCAFVADPSGF